MNQHPLEIVPSKSEKRYLQSRHEIFRPTPLSIAFCGISTSGKSSQMTTVANLLFPIMDNIVLISHTHREDPAWGPLKQRNEERQISRGEHPDTHPFEKKPHTTPSHHCTAKGKSARRQGKQRSACEAAPTDPRRSFGRHDTQQKCWIL